MVGLMELRVVAGIALVALVIAILAFVVFGSGNKDQHATAYVPAAGPSAGSEATTTVTPASVEFYAINYQYVYNGPASVGGSSCSYSSYTTVDSQTEILNGSQAFDLVLTPSSSQCPMKIESVNSSTAGFRFATSDPGLPFYLPPYSNADLQVTMIAPNTNFYGPLTVTIYYG